MPAESKWLDEHLRCPRCRSRIRRSDAGAVCENYGCGRRFPAVAGQPVLIDFDNSVVEEASLTASRGQSVIARGSPGGGWKRSLLRLLKGTNSVAERSSRRVIELLRPVSPVPVLLVVGGGAVGSGAEALYEDGGGVRVVAFDIYASPVTDFVADAHAIPLADGSVDGVWVQAVLEHVLVPETVAGEIHRVLKPGGVVYADTPFMQQVHEGPWDFTRFSESGHRWLFRRFERIESGAVSGPGAALVWAISYAAAGLLRSRKAGRIVGLLFFWLRFLDHVTPPRFAVDGASAVYFLGRKGGTAVTPREIVRHYQGAQ